MILSVYYCEDIEDLNSVCGIYNLKFSDWFPSYGDVYKFPTLVWKTKLDEEDARDAEEIETLSHHHQPLHKEAIFEEYFEILEASIHIKSGESIKDYYPELLI